MQVNALYHRKSNRVPGVYKESRYTLIILNAFTYKMIYAGFHHQTFRTQHILNSFLEITGKLSLYRLLNSLALLFYSSIQETQLATTYGYRTKNDTQLRSVHTEIN